MAVGFPAIFALAASLIAPADASARCRQALVLGLDVSGSVDAGEYRLQIDGLAAALQRPQVREAFLAFPAAPVRLMVFEWAGIGGQRVVLPWTTIGSMFDLNAAARSLRATPRRALPPATAVGQAMLFAADALAAQPDCWRRTLDLSGDGKSNVGPRPRDARAYPGLNDVTVNALVIGTADRTGNNHSQAEIADLWAYFSRRVIRGANAFVEVAVGFQDFENAMARKLLRELQSVAVSQLPQPAERGAIRSDR